MRLSIPRRDLILALPTISLALIALLMGVLLWLYQAHERENERHTLIMDTLWAEQTLRFQLGSDEEKLRLLAEDLGRGMLGPLGFEGKARQMMAGNPEFTRLRWLEADGALRAALPPLPSLAEHDPAQLPLNEVRALGRPAYGLVSLAAGRGARDAPHLPLVTPIFRDGRYSGALVVDISLQALISQHVPWWFTERYRLVLLDANNAQLAAKPEVLPDPLIPTRELPTHRMPLDPPGQGVTLLVTLYRSGPWEAQAGIVAAISILALVAGASLLTARRQMRGRKRAEQALRAEHAFRKAMEDSLTVGMRARDLAGRITYVNPAFCAMTGYSPDELIGQEPPMPYWVPEDYDRTREVHDAVLVGTPYPSGFELRFQRRDGEKFDALIYEAPLIDADGKHTGWMGSFVDITDRKRAEEGQRQQQEKLQQTSRLVTMGEMASTLAHELNQPLSAITSYATGSLNRLQAAGGDPELEKALTKLSLQARRAGAIIRRIHDFVRKREPRLTACTLPEIAQDALSFLAPDARKLGVILHTDLPDDLPPIRADRILIEQVIVNLARNAIEAMTAVPRGRRVLSVTATAQADRVEVRVQDSGPGIPAAQQENLFNAFFSTKPDGMGMGLNICRSLIEFHHGRLWYETAADGGGVFSFTIPRATEDEHELRSHH
ncbi:PAS domain-containing sensor histidine kinase [Elstera cyanobacteriorum]|uniref:histidine kinase n=1 Tax=Elstera cyanobacteriorum TaxID=2022747 RepID=A0A255XNM0_9PROT|nr:PAS domain-containing sensor histidine kinase [Elstera cyanobacteriorum]OYQ17860.1 hypothetical protein CHR90_12865 [Elstera cyanobacteriorum]GFZ85530.1 PAS domain-containing sensor histidine kinase [Elstera cyanobacteriorum]